MNDLDVEKASSGEILASLFEKCDFVFDTVTILNFALIQFGRVFGRWFDVIKGKYLVN